MADKSAAVERVIVVFKTHLDIGFTGLAADVLHDYCERFIPAAVDLAFAANANGSPRFVWTVGSYLVHHYLAVTPEASPVRARFLQAIQQGWICWHHLACTTHTELMNEALLDYDLSLADALDARFGRRTIAAKLTDVPGHTMAMIPALQRHGVEFLHIGVNGASRVPGVPPLFRWQLGGAEVAVGYGGGYGQSLVLPNGVALEFAHANDNAGPPSLEELNAIYAALGQRYPGAQISAGTLCDFARALREGRALLPVITQEIGDTWIHGVASDPGKTAQFLRLLSLTEGWTATGALPPGSKLYSAVMEPLLLVAEHTWGMDSKKHLLDFSHWGKSDFQAARRKNITTLESFGAANEALLRSLLPELSACHGGHPASSYAQFEQSHAEQRAYLGSALDALPPALAAAARAELHWQFPKPDGALVFPGRTIELAGWRVWVGAHGELERIENATLGIAQDCALGRFCYDTYSAATVERCYRNYGRDLAANDWWAAFDFAKPGLQAVSGLVDQSFLPELTELRAQGETLTAFLAGAPDACEPFGCPRALALQYHFTETGIRIALYWKNKDACRTPEGLWLGLDAGVANPAQWRMRKLGQWLSPFDVVPGGARKLHCVQQLRYAEGQRTLTLTPQDAPLFAFGARSLYDTADQYDNPAGGLYALLCNNRWGTNFKQWFEEDARVVFRLEFDVDSPA